MSLSRFIVFEGGEGAGKTTVIDAVEKALAAKGVAAVRTREPGSTALGEKIRDLLLQGSSSLPICNKAELLLFLAARAQNLEEVIKPALARGGSVLCDRFNASTIAYQGWARGLGYDDVSRLCSYVSGDVQPDLTFFLDLDPAVGLARAAKVSASDRIESEKIEFHRKVREGFLKVAKEHPSTFCIIDAQRSAHEVFEQVWTSICAKWGI